MMARVYLKRQRFCLVRLFYEKALAFHRAKDDHVGAYADAQELADALKDRYDFEAALKLARIPWTKPRIRGIRRSSHGRCGYSLVYTTISETMQRRAPHTKLRLPS
jgi:hypothetical protein